MLDKIFAEDKAGHFCVAFTLFVLAVWIIPFPIYGFIAALAFGWGKEGYDWLKNKRFDWYDLLASLAGASFACLLWK